MFFDSNSKKYCSTMHVFHQWIQVFAAALMHDFDELIGAVLDFAAEDGETLVVVTSDHETGGFTLSGENYTTNEGEVYSSYSKLEPKFSTGGHSATLIPVFAYGPGAEHFSGVYDNTDIFHKIMKLTGWDKN